MSNECVNCYATNDTVTIKMNICKDCLIEYLNEFKCCEIVDDSDIVCMNALHGEDEEECDKYIKKICSDLGIEISGI